jgi:hypothetical protein
MLSDQPPSRASPLPQGIALSSIIIELKSIVLDGRHIYRFESRFLSAIKSSFFFLSSVDATFDPKAIAPEMIHEPYRYRRRHPDGLFLGP